MTDGKSHQSKDALLEHLESIRTALDKDRRDAAASEAGADAEPAAAPNAAAGEHAAPRPAAEDGAAALDEPTSPGYAPAGGQTGGLDDGLFEALLGEPWRQSAATLLEAGRAEIEAHRNHWVPDDTDKLNEALRERIDTTLEQWLRELVARNLDDLRTALLAAVAAELKARIEVVLTREAGPDARGSDENDG